MNLQKSFIKNILPYQKHFKCCDIYNYEIRKIEQEIAKSLNTKNIHTALDIPDFRSVKDSKVFTYILKLCINKLKIFEQTKLEHKQNKLILKHNTDIYQVIKFVSGELPLINDIEKNLIFFMYQPGFNKIFYCGRYNFKSKPTKSEIAKFYEDNCESGTQLFITIKSLQL